MKHKKTRTAKVKAAVSDAIKAVDIFSEPIYLNMKGKKKLSTSLGSILSVILITYLLFEGIQQCISMFKRENPQIYQINEMEDDPTVISLNNTNNFIFAVSISRYAEVLNLTQGSPLSFAITFNQYIRPSPNATRVKLKNIVYMAPCNASNFPESIYGAGTFESLNLNKAFCPIYVNYNVTKAGCPSDVLAHNPNCLLPPYFNVSGTYLSNNFQFIQLNLQACTSATTATTYGVKCTNNSITKLLNTNEYKVNLFYANSRVDSRLYKIPNATYIESTYWEINPLISKTANLFADKDITQDFDSYYSQSTYRNRTFYSMQPSKIQELQDLKTSSLPLLQWNIRRSSYNMVTTRTYARVQDVMTSLGGFAQAVMFIAAFLAIGYVEYKYQMTLSNEFYHFDMAKKDEDDDNNKEEQKPHKKSTKPKNKKSKKDEKEQQVGENLKELEMVEAELPKQINHDEDFGQETYQVITKYFEKQRRIKQPLNFGLLNYVAMVGRWLTCRRNEQDKIVIKARKMAEEELDITRVIQKLKEIDKMKVLLLNRYQREVFNFIEKPLVTLEKEEPASISNQLPDLSFDLPDSKDDEKIPTSIAEKTDYENLPKYARLYMTYRYLIEDVQKDNLSYNRKLLDMMGKDLIHVFQKVDYLTDKNPDPRRVEEVIKVLFENQKDE